MAGWNAACFCQGVGTYYTALSGMTGFSTAVDTVAHNLANLRTTGYKASDVEFSAIMNDAVRLGTQPKGQGIALPVAVTNFRQGAIETTNGPLDAAIGGNGFFVTRSSSGEVHFTRNGEFQVGTSGSGSANYLLSSSGERVQGFLTGAPPVATDIQLPSLRAPVATTGVTVSGNLSSTIAIGGHTSAEVKVYDATGAEQTMTLDFVKTAANEWTLTASVPGTAGTPATIQFNTNGTLLGPATISGPGGTTISLVDGTNNALLTQYGSAPESLGVSQNGKPAATATGFYIDNGGAVMGVFSDGSKEQVATLVLGQVANPDTMVPVVEGTYRVTSETMGADKLIALDPQFVGDASKLGSSILGGATEQSTTDIASELTRLIIYQRGYQANTKSFTVGDEMRQEANQLIR